MARGGTNINCPSFASTLVNHLIYCVGKVAAHTSNLMDGLIRGERTKGLWNYWEMRNSAAFPKPAQSGPGRFTRHKSGFKKRFTGKLSHGEITYGIALTWAAWAADNKWQPSNLWGTQNVVVCSQDTGLITELLGNFPTCFEVWILSSTFFCAKRVLLHRREGNRSGCFGKRKPCIWPFWEVPKGPFPASPFF